MGLFSSDNNLALAAKLTTIERKLDAIMAHLGIEHDGHDMNDIRDLIAAGKKLAAIKLYRERTGAGLAEAKDAVERGL